MDSKIILENKNDQQTLKEIIICSQNFSDFLGKLDSFKNRAELYKQYVKINGCIDSYKESKKISSEEFRKYNSAIELSGKKFFVVKSILKNISDSDFSALTASGIAYQAVESTEKKAWAEVENSKSSSAVAVPNFSLGTVLFITLLMLALYNKSQNRDKIQEIAYITDAINAFNKKIKEKNNKKNDI